MAARCGTMLAGRFGRLVAGCLVSVVALVSALVVVSGCAVIGHPGSSQPTSAALRSSARPSATPSASSPPVQPVASLAPVLAPAGKVADSEPAAIARRIASAGSVSGAHISAAVLSADSGKLLYSHGAQTGLIPASTTKLLTTSVALKLLGPDHRFQTSVVQAPGTSHGSHQLVLVGGGDPYLAETEKQATDPGQASLQALAAATAKKLKAAKITSVRLGYDASLFSGPSWNPTWPDGYSTVVTPTSALWANEGQLYGSEGPRQSKPADAAAAEFAALLREQHIKITSVAAAKTPKGSRKIAVADSLPLGTIIEKLLMASDNDAAEVIARQDAIAAGRPGTITDAVHTIKKVLTGLGAWTAGTRMYDGCGLSRDGRIPAETLVKVLRLGISGEQPSMARVFTGLPVAGVEGSLRYRLSESRATAGQGLVRAKTGTLHSVHSLAGYTYTRDGELLIFAFVVNGAKNDWSAVTWLDRVSAAVSTCGCSS